MDFPRILAELHTEREEIDAVPVFTRSDHLALELSYRGEDVQQQAACRVRLVRVDRL